MKLELLDRMGHEDSVNCTKIYWPLFYAAMWL